MTQRAPGWRRGVMRVALAAAVAGLLGCRGEPPAELEVTVRHVAFDPDAAAPVVMLETRDGASVLPIWIGTAEAQAIARALQEVRLPRPMTHDLMIRVLDAADIELRRVRITELRDRTFYAILVLGRGGRELEVDSRPSDAIALALRAASPITVARALLEHAGEPLRAAAASVRSVWGMTVQDLTPALAEVLGLASSRGVVISDVAVRTRHREGFRRGDVVVAVDGDDVQSVAELASVATRAGAHRVVIQRGARRLTLSVSPRQG